MGDFREHGVMLYLDKTLYKAFIRLQADKGLGRSYAGLLPLTEGLFHLGYLSREEYDEHVRRYSQGLELEAKPLTLEQVKEREEIEKLDRLFSNVHKNWNNLPEKAKKHHLAKAKQYQGKVTNAKLVLTLVEEGASCERKEV